MRTESPSVRNKLVMRFWNSRSQLAVRRSGRIRLIGHSVKRREAHADRKTRRNRANPVHDFPQESRPILKTSTVLPFSFIPAMEFMHKVFIEVLIIFDYDTMIL